MARKIRIRIRPESGEHEEVVEVELSEEDWKTLQRFTKYAGRLRDTSLVKEGIPASLSLNWTEKEGLKIEAKVPEAEKIDSMLMKLRGPFLLKKERTFFPRVRNILYKAVESSVFRKHLDTLLYLFSGRRLHSLLVAGASTSDYPEGVIINSEEMLDVWLNGCQFHVEEEKEKIFDAMHGLLPPDSSIALLLFLVTDKVRAILGLERLISLFSGQRETIFAEVLLEEPIYYHAFLHASAAQFDFLARDEGANPLPNAGGVFARVFDLTHLGPAVFHQFLGVVGQLWMREELVCEMGERTYFFRVAPGFRTEDGHTYENGVDIIVTFNVVAFLVEDPLSKARRKPEQVTRDLMRGGVGDRGVVKAVETEEELARILERDPKPRVEWTVVPRVAFEFAYWPLSRQALDRLERIWREGRKPTFDEVEGTDLFQAWEIFEDAESLAEDR
jgi:hypothetical protein